MNKNTLALYESNGEQKTKLEMQITNPLFDSADRFLIIGESNGKKIYVIEDKEIAWESEVEGNISKVYVNKNGYVAVIMTGTSYKSEVQVFDPQGNSLFISFLSYTMAVDVAISNDNKYLSYLVSHYLDYCYNINSYE